MNHSLQEQIDYLEQHRLSPIDYLIAKFKDYDVILLGETHSVKQNLDFVINSIPYLYEAGVNNIGMEFGAREDQETLDKLVTSDEFDESLAKQLMYNYNVKWPYKEYWDIYKAVWSFNSKLDDDKPKFRIINLSYIYNWEGFSGIRTPESAKKIFYKGNTEIYRYNVIKEEIIDNNQRILVLTGTPHAFTRYKYPIYDANDANFTYFQGNFLGNLLYNDYKEKVYSIILHQWFMNKTTMDNQSPADGKIEEIMGYYNNDPQGFDLVNTPMGNLTDNSYYSMGYDNFKLKDFFDGYIFLTTLSNLEGCTVDYSYLDNKDFADVQKNYPDKDWSKIPDTIEEYWRYVEEFVTYK